MENDDPSIRVIRLMRCPPFEVMEKQNRIGNLSLSTLLFAFKI